MKLNQEHVITQYLNKMLNNLENEKFTIKNIEVILNPNNDYKITIVSKQPYSEKDLCSIFCLNKNGECIFEMHNLITL